MVRLSPVCRCGKVTINTDCLCDKCKDIILRKALDEEKQMTTRLFDSCFKEVDVDGESN